MDSLSAIFDGWHHELKPGEDFLGVGATVIADWDFEEEEQLGAWESPAPYPVLKDGSAVYGKGSLPFQVEEASWSGLALALRSMSDIISGNPRSEIFQNNTYTNGAKDQPRYTFRYVAAEDGSGYQGGRL